MAVDTREMAIGNRDHMVHFYAHDADLCEAVGAYLADGLSAGAVAVVIAVEGHRRGIEAELRAAGIDVDAATRDETLLLLDAAATMDQFISRGQIDADAFRRVVGGIIRQAASTGRPVQAYGEMVAVLWEAGDVVTAIELEELWNELGGALRFSLLCAYHAPSVSGPDKAETLVRICQLHSSVSGEQPADRAREPVEISGEFPAEPTAPGAARRFVAEALQRHGYAGRLLDDVQLVLSELATNAVAHARSPFSVVARFQGTGVRVAVRDASRDMPTLRDEGPMARSGRGLQLVAALARDWGVEVTSEGKTVWAELQP